MYSFQHDRRQVTQTTSQGNGGKCKTRMDTTNTNTNTNNNNNNINKDEDRNENENEIENENENENEIEVEVVNNFVWNEPYPDHPLSPSTTTNEDTSITTIGLPSPSRPSSISTSTTISSSPPTSSTPPQWPQSPSSASPPTPSLTTSPSPLSSPPPPPQQFSNYASPQPSLITASASQQLSPPSSSTTPSTTSPPPTTPPSSSSPTPPTTTPPPSSPGPDKDSTLSLLKDPCFLIFCTTAFLIQLTNNIAPMFYPSYAQSMGLPSEQTAKIVSVFGISNTVGRFVTGLLSQLGVNNLLLYSAGTVLTGVLYFLIPLYTSYETLLASAAGQAFFIGVFPPLQSVILVELLGLERLPYSFGLMTFCKSVGSIAGPSLSGALYQVSSDYTLPFVFAGSVLSAANLLHIALAVLTRRKSKRLGTVPVS